MSRCEHRWIYKYSARDRVEQGHMSSILKKIDVYYCEKCLVTFNDVVKEVVSYRGDNYPQWWIDMNKS